MVREEGEEKGGVGVVTVIAVATFSELRRHGCSTATACLAELVAGGILIMGKAGRG